MPLSEDKISIKSLQERKGHNALQFITEFMKRLKLDEEQHQQLLVKFRTVDRRLGSGRRSAHTDKNVDTVESLLLQSTQRLNCVDV